MENVISLVEDRLKNGQWKLTNRRKHILTVLLENRGKHLSVEEVHGLANQKAPYVGLATVYRTLELFLLNDVVQSMDFGDGRKRYELCDPGSGGQQHHHLICIRCGNVVEFSRDLLKGLEPELNMRYKFKVETLQLNVFGFCRKCRPEKGSHQGTV